MNMTAEGGNPIETELRDPARGELRPAPIQTTIAQLACRIGERFPGSGLSKVAQQLIQLGAETETEIVGLRRPILWLRALIVLAIAGVIATVAWGLFQLLRVGGGESGNLSDVLQGIDAAISQFIALGLALLFLVSAETRLKRQRALRLLFRLRSIAHVVDMHQLAKDPEYALYPPQATASSPPRQFSRFLLARYLDYCSELLALISKLAALHTQYLHDPVVLNAVNDIESLTTGLSAKIWQKIMILDIAGEVEGATTQSVVGPAAPAGAAG